MFEVPDLEHGYMLNTYDDFNRFRTFVEAALTRRDDGGPVRHAYLSSRCRPESVSPDTIFNGLMYYFGVVASDWEGTFALYMGSSLASRNFLEPDPVPPERTPLTAKVHCPLVAARPLAFDEALADLQSEAPGTDNKLYMAVEWRADGRDYALYTPCRYINFPNPTLDHAGLWKTKPAYQRHEPRYIQPISGVVLTEVDGRIEPAFVAVHLTESGTARIEFCVRAPISFFSLRPQTGWKKRIMDFLAASWIGRYFRVSEFHRVMAVEGTCTLYRHS
jgi:hypothetical protein